MKNLFSLIGLSVLGAACQPQVTAAPSSQVPCEPTHVQTTPTDARNGVPSTAEMQTPTPIGGAFRVNIDLDRRVTSSRVIGSALHHASVAFYLSNDASGDTRGTLERLVVEAAAEVVASDGRVVMAQDLDEIVHTCTLNRDDVEVATGEVMGSQIRFENLNLRVVDPSGGGDLEMRCDYMPTFPIPESLSIVVRYGVPWYNGAKLREPNGEIHATLDLSQNRLHRSVGEVTVTVLPQGAQ